MSEATKEQEQETHQFSFLDWRKHLSLPKPTNFEDLHKELKFMFPAYNLFDGAKADIVRAVSPILHVLHSFHLGSMAPNVPSYTFGAFYGDDKTSLHGTMSSSGVLLARGHISPIKGLVARLQYQQSLASPNTRLSAEAEYCGRDYVFNVKALDPSIAAMTGTFVASYVQSLTKKWVGGVELVYQKPIPKLEDAALSYALRYNGNQWNAAATLVHYSALNLSYYQKISDRVELGTEINVGLTGKREAVTTVGGKVEFKSSAIRFQVDTKAKTAMFFEHRLGNIMFNVSGEIDHLKMNGKFGIGLQVESQ